MASTNRIIELSSLIARETALINDFLVKNNLPTPSLDADALQSIPIPDSATDIEAARTAVIEACSELKALMTGPKELLRFKWTAYASVKAILRFKLDRSFPVGESTSFEAMSKFSGLSEMNVRRLVRHAIINHRFFQENAPGVITHSALTAILSRDDMARNLLVVELDEFWPAGVKMADALERWPNSEECNETGFSLANNSKKSMYDIFAENPSRGERFGQYFAQPGNVDDGIFDNYPWGDKQTMVDVGGSYGSVAIGIAERFPNMMCFVQDLPDTVVEGASRVPAELQKRITFMAHDFFTPQPLSVDVYFFRSIFHNWADKYCVKILQNLVPALKPGAVIIIHERVLPSFDSMDTVDARRAINLDVGMLQLLNAQQREIHEWPELFRRADPRFHYLGAHQPAGAMRWIITAEWRG
ncbi:S-adenosyl-L-methionine-dependent methyltransferase [Annulohypoxylon truncatum]|uniref:S-adenosyl-L-methionine-dependent methyltransferase n=1 Tax=Annulohypoxylon truncatum TaxID=327061 RepID=UPI0020072D34|nr:S-adenosyl-L-methionine-dependent methyltransferase [Annulohypoxylon truncatum]KAI1204780.1 S-adenosyl-L-methionine-dependent methyltransferase [Annulohypoxylon truncatum]